MRDDSMIDPLDREIARALAVDPSPEFVVRVRQRIAKEPARAVWSFRWIAIAGAAVAAAAVIALILMPRAVTQPALLVTRASAGTGTLPAAAVTDSGVGRTPRFDAPPDGGHPHVAGPQRRHRVESEILVDPREANAMRHVLDRLEAGRMYVTPFADLEQPIYIAPIDIKGVQP